MLVELNAKLTLAAVKLDRRVAACSLLSIPEGKWRTFTRLVYVHFISAALLFTFGVICFCLGMQYSGMYTEVNCANGTNIWIPLLNLIVSFSGLFTLRTLHLHWPAFIHCLGLCIMMFMMLAPIIDSALASSRWLQTAKHPLDCWASNFTWIDLALSLLASLNENRLEFDLFSIPSLRLRFYKVVCFLLMVLLVKYWYKRQPSDGRREMPSTITSHA
ncbi:hypothetical protein Tcan_18117 [Toxocara canis]|uniref:Uncharacterized protein n=1 Tax=Toxocara canis TaxID=6265 RepID=A0A0B2UZQ6_TOXCA|nr:hypothetical protein Tcan_18117 [Toxocara canis]